MREHREHHTRVRPIALLPRDVTERIAAGEIIERPASLVRELVDNALDAGADVIRVELRDGGLRLIRVIDDGCGIPRDELTLACQRHATSKVRSLHDLECIGTLGFRGEALASIAAVAELDLVSASDDSGLATGITIERDSEPTYQQSSRSRGTTVTVQHLFQTVPARRALLRGPAAESAQCLTAIRGYALIHPSVQFSLVVDGELVLRTPGTTLRDTTAAIFGSDVARELIPFESTEANGVHISGVISARGFTHPTREHLVIAVNNRLVSNRALLAAMEAGYRPLLRKGRHPLVVVSIALTSDRVDANIHPAKATVLVRDERAIAQAVRTAIHTALGAAPVSAALRSPVPTASHFARPLQLQLAVPRTRRGLRIREHRATYRLPEHADADSDTSVGKLTALSQFDNTLIVARASAAHLYLVDQHRAHERILYQHLQQQSPATRRRVDHGYTKAGAAAPGLLASQSLLEPLLVELTPRQSTLLAGRLDELAALGLDCQPFGGSVFLVRAVPVVPGAAVQPAAFAEALAQDAAEDTHDWLDQVRISLACRSAIRRGQPLTLAEQQALLDDLADVPTVASCPHGSPLLVRYSQEFLTHLFEW